VRFVRKRAIPHGGLHTGRDIAMKKIEAIIRHVKLDAVKDALSRRGLFPGMTIADTHGVGSEHGRPIVYRGNVCARPFVPRVKLEVVTSDDKAESVVACILNAAYTGEVGDGRVLVSNVERVVRIRNGEEVRDSCVARVDNGADADEAESEAPALWHTTALRPTF
jgi:nitrogen regulatory protein P-II 1